MKDASTGVNKLIPISRFIYLSVLLWLLYSLSSTGMILSLG